jgi:predicted ATPase
VRPDFALTEGNARAVSAICVRMDGVPLAIELAAARVRMFAVEAIAERLTDRFRLLKNRDVTAPSRHQTLRATIDWSYDLLAQPEKRLLRILAVFVGGWTVSEPRRWVQPKWRRRTSSTASVVWSTSRWSWSI